MPSPTQILEDPINSLIKRCPDMRTLRQIHAHFLKSPLGSSSYALSKILAFSALSASGDIAYARRLFAQFPNPNVFSWNSMIRGCSLVPEQSKEPISLYKRMLRSGFAHPNSFTVAFVLKAVISACAKAGALDLGRWVHAFIDRKGIELDLELSTALIDMYAKCGAIEKAREVFDGMDVRDPMAWSSMIVGLAIHGHVKDALELFTAMLDSQVKPNHVTFIGVLSACAHSGLVSDGRRYWSTMQELGVAPLMEHYGCMVDLLCRAGRLEEAYTFVNDMPIVPNSVIWRTLLVGCKNSRTFDEAETAAEQLLQLEPLNAENYVLLSNLYASRCQWDKVRQMRKKMKDHGVKVVPGGSSTEIDGFVHEFTVADDTHPEIKEIREMLRDIAERVRRAGHEPWTSAVLHDVVEVEKQSALCEHSERLAIAYGMLKTEAPVVIRVVKNLRVCGDCHEVTKIISQIYDREIIVRDRVRFHRFVNGTCSCSDFW
ncbi:hypothetical protein GW17_00016331 [Ensete ventricosum]|nr:hypothetical protein GW17_00016331 [Ensete ventricosum]RZR91055.1 hypothetical protein BHM03_00019093 [Ensete ventricosum]